MSRINKFYASFKRRGGEVFELGPDHTIVTADNRPFATRVRHGLISALAGDNLVMLNAEVALAETLYPEAGALIVGNTFKTPVIQP